ncbi:hypothetical protein CK203_107137 [Vitis vinifera]|uniref:Uncharacterized protein n=1 Tax=Vitis vinifera TaxID=29760 RepID=A0A438CVK2_VITVI|nr:hypothetical protein CK203_107137 [Vitis vinifera]
MDFYQSMTTKQVRDPTLIHFTIDGRHGILGARHIAEALHIPYEPTHFEDFRVWTSPTELEMVHTLSRGASTRPHLLRGELPPSMFLIDAFLRHNIYPLQHWTQRRGVLLEALFKISEGYFFGPHHLIMAALLYFEEKCIRRSCRELMPFHFSFHGAMPDSGASGHIEWSSQGGHSQLRYQLPGEHPHVIYLRSSLAQEMAAIRACQEQMFATQTQHTAILRQIQHHLGIISPPEHSIPIPPSHHRPLLLYIRLCLEEPTTGEAEAAEPSSHIILQPPSDHFHSFLYICPLCISLIFPYLE